MKANVSTFFFAKTSTIVLLFLSIILLCYFSWGLYSSIKFRELIDRASPLYGLLKDISKERSARLIKAFHSDVDIDLDELKEITDASAKSIDMSDYFFYKLKTIRENFDMNVSNREFLLEFSELDKYILAEFDKLHLQNVNSEINGIIMAMWQTAKDNIRQNNIKDLLVKIAWDGKILSNDDLLLLDDLYFVYSNYLDIMHVYQVPASFATFNKVDLEEIKVISNQDKEYSKYNIERFYSIVHNAITKGEITTSPNIIMDVSKKIENKNGENMEFLIDFAKKTQLNSIYIIGFYTCVSFFIVLFCAYTFLSLRIKEKRFLENLELSEMHTQNLKAVARFRGKNPDDAEIYKLFGEISEHFNDMDKIEQKNKNEYSFFMDLITSGIKNPLSDIVINIQLLQMLDTNTDKHKEYFGKILQSTGELDNLFNAILKISSIQAKNLNLDLIEVDIFDSFNNILRDIRDKINNNTKKRITFIAYIDPELEGRAIYDRQKLRFILTTLLENAIKFGKNFGTIALLIKCERTDIEGERIIKRARISVIDNGEGFNQAELKEQNKLSDNLRVHSTKGLSLTITKEYLNVMGSKLEINSTSGGTRASFALSAEFHNNANNLKGTYAGKKIYIYEKSLPKMAELTASGNDRIPSSRELLESYLKYLGFDYEFINAELEEKDAIYLVMGNTEPFSMQKCIFCSVTPPDVITDDKVHVEIPFCVDRIAAAYDIITGETRSEEDVQKLNATALVLASPEIATLVGRYIHHVKLDESQTTKKDNKGNEGNEDKTLVQKFDGKYDIAFIDTDVYKNVSVNCPVVSISSEELKSEDINFNLMRSIICNKSRFDRLKEEINYSVNLFKRRKGLISGGIRDILLFKKSLAANNIYKSAMLSFANSVDVVNSEAELYEKLEQNTYKVVMCDCGIKGLTYEAYMNKIKEARIKRAHQTVAMLFKGSNDIVHVKDFFKIVPADIKKRDLEQTLVNYLSIDEKVEKTKVTSKNT